MALAAGALATLVSVGGTASAAKIGHVVTIPGSASLGFFPRPVVITKGSTSALHNFDIAQHDVVSDSGLFASPLIGVGKAADIVGTASLSAGTYAFHCSIHPNMRANLIVR